MLKEERFEVILNQLKIKTKVTYEKLAIDLNVSEDTIRRDIDILHKNGLLSKVRGGAIVRERDPLSFHDREAAFTEEKNVIALKVQRFFKDGMTVFMDGGTSICAVGNYLPTDINLRIITNNYSLVQVISKFPNIEIIMLGGRYEPDLAVVTGITTCHEASQYIADLFIMGTCAIDVNFGVTAFSMSDVETKRVMVKQSRKIISLASQSKLRRAESFKVCDIQDVDVLVTDLPSDSTELDDVRGKGVQLL